MITPYSNIISVTTLEALLLDTYSGAAAAYSLRKLSASYTGSAIKVRRSVGSPSEKDIGFVNNELDVADLESFCSGTDGFVVTWYDQSGNANDATQTTAANQPQIVSNGNVILDNGKPSVYFNASTGKMTLNALFTQQPFTVIGVNNLQRASGILADTINGFFGNRQSTGEVILRTNVSLTYGTYPTSQNIFYGLANSTISQIYINGVLGIQGDAGNTYSNWIYLGWAGAYNTYPTGYISEIIAYNSNQSSNRTGIETNINTNYQIYWDGSQTSLLDTYSGSAAAYSLRALSSAYTGPLVRVRRSSDNAEQDIYAKYDGTLNVSALESFCSGTNGFVTKWYDQSGNGRDATQTTLSSQGKIVSSGSVILENGKPTCQYDGVDDNYIISINISSTDTSIFAVATQRNNSDRQDLLRGSSGNLFFGSYVTGTEYRYRGGTSVNSYATINTNQNLHTAINTSTQSKAAINNNTLNVVSDTHINETTIYWGNYIHDSGYVWEGNVQELIYYFSDQSSNRTGIETNINTYYSIF